MVTITVDSKDKLEFLRIAVEHCYNITSSTVIDSLRQLFSVESDKYSLTDAQEKVFRQIMLLYNDLSADFVTWSDEFINQLPAVALDAPRFYEVLEKYNLKEYASKAYFLFKYWQEADSAYFNVELIKLIDETSRTGWTKVSAWCVAHKPDLKSCTSDELVYYRKEYM